MIRPSSHIRASVSFLPEHDTTAVVLAAFLLKRVERFCAITRVAAIRFGDCPGLANTIRGGAKISFCCRPIRTEEDAAVLFAHEPFCRAIGGALGKSGIRMPVDRFLRP